MFEFFSSAKSLVLSKTAKSASVVFLGNAAASVLGIIFTLVAAKSLGPSDWGYVAAVGNFIPVLVAFTDLGIGASLFQKTSGKWAEGNFAQKLYNSAFLARLGVTLAVTLLLLTFSWWSPFVYGVADSPLVLFTALGFLGMSLLDFQIFSIEARANWKKAAIFIALTNTTRVLLTFLLVAMGQVTLFNILAVFSLSGLLTSVLSFLFQRYEISAKVDVRGFIGKSLGFSSFMSVNKIVSTVSSRADVLLLLTLAGPYEAGIYGVASRLAMGVPLFVGSFATVIASGFASIDEKEKVAKYFRKAIGLSLIMVLGVFVGILVTPLVTGFLGSEYADSQAVLQLLLLAMLPFVLATPAVNLLIYYYKNPGIIAAISIVQFILVFGVNYLLIKDIGVFAPVIALGLSNILSLAVSYLFVFLKFKHYG